MKQSYGLWKVSSCIERESTIVDIAYYKGNVEDIAFKLGKETPDRYFDFTPIYPIEVSSSEVDVDTAPEVYVMVRNDDGLASADGNDTKHYENFFKHSNYEVHVSKGKIPSLNFVSISTTKTKENALAEARKSALSKLSDLEKEALGLMLDKDKSHLGLE